MHVLQHADGSVTEKDCLRIMLFILLEVILILAFMLVLNIIGVSPTLAVGPELSRNYRQVLLLLFYPVMPMIFTLFIASTNYLILQGRKPLVEKKLRVLIFKVAVGILCGAPLLFLLAWIFYTVFGDSLKVAVKQWDCWKYCEY